MDHIRPIPLPHPNLQNWIPPPPLRPSVRSSQSSFSYVTIFPAGCLLYCTVLFSTVLYCAILYYNVLYCTIFLCHNFPIFLCHNFPCGMSTVLYCTVQYCTVLYCTVLYCTILYNNLLRPFDHHIRTHRRWPLYYTAVY